MPPHYIEPISRCWLRRTNFLESVLSPPLSLFSAIQQTRGAHRLFAHMQSHMSVKTQEDPLNLHIFHLDVLVMKNKPNKDLRWLRESWIRGSPDSRTIPSAGLLDYEDTRLKTSSRVRKEVSLAWKASLAIQIYRSPTVVLDSM